MQNDALEPRDPTPSDTTPVLSPSPVLAGMKNIQPISDHIVIDPVPQVVHQSPVVALDNVNQTESIQDDYISPPIPSLNGQINQPTPSMNQAEKAIRRQTIAGVVISVIGILLLLSSAYSIYGLYTDQSDHSSNGFGYIIYGVQAFVSLGLIFRKEVFRWLLLIFTTFSLVFNIYIGLVGSAVVSVATDNPALPALVLFALTIKFVMPVAVIIMLNLPSVKNSFN